MNDSQIPRTELDFKYIWKCEECSFESFIMYKADTHQTKTDHCMTRLSIDELRENEKLKND